MSVFEKLKNLKEKFFAPAAKPAEAPAASRLNPVVEGLAKLPEGCFGAGHAPVETPKAS